MYTLYIIQCIMYNSYTYIYFETQARNFETQARNFENVFEVLMYLIIPELVLYLLP